MNRLNKFSPVIYVFAFFMLLVTPAVSFANVPLLTVEHEEYLPPGQNFMNLTLSMGQVPGPVLNAKEIDRYPVYKGIFYTSTPYQGLASTAGMPNSGWLPLLLDSASTTINWSALGAEPRKRISFFAVIFSYDGKLLALSEEQHVTTGMRISTNPANRIATIWTASKEAVTDHVVSAILPFELGQNRGKEVVIEGPDGKLIPAQEFKQWALYANNADDTRHDRLTFPVNFRQPGGQAYEVYLEDDTAIDDPVCTVTPAVRDFLATGAIKFKAVGPRPNEFYEANLNDINFIDRTPTGPFFIETKENGPIQHITRFSLPLKPTGLGQHLPDVGIVDIYLTYNCGEESVNIHGTLNNSSIRVEPTQAVTASYDDIVLRNIQMEITPRADLSAHGYVLPNNGGPFDGTNTYRYGTQRVDGNTTIQELFPSAPAHELRSGMRHAFGPFVITPTTNAAAIQRGRQIARLTHNAIVVNAENVNHNSWFKLEVSPGTGISRMPNVPASERADLMRQAIDRINPYTLSGGQWVYPYEGLWASANPGTCPYNFFGQPHGANTGGVDVQYVYNGAVPLFNSINTGTAVVDALETLKLIVDGTIRRDNMGLHYDAATGRPVTYRDLLTRMGTTANNPLMVRRQFNLVFGRVNGHRLYNTCGRDYPLYQCTRDSALLSNYDANIAYLPEVPYRYEMDLDPNNKWTSHDHQHAVREINKLGVGLAALADHKDRDYVMEMAEGVILLAAINDENNGSHLRSYLRNSSLTPYEATAGNRTLEPLMMAGLGLFLQGRSAVDDVITNEILDIIARAIPLGQMRDIGLAGDRYTNGDSFPAVQARLSQYFGAPVKIAEGIQPYESSLYFGSVLSLVRALEQSENPAVQRSLQIMKQGLKEAGTKAYDYFLGTLKINSEGLRASHYNIAHKVEFIGSNPRAFAIIPTILSARDPAYALDLAPSEENFRGYHPWVTSNVWDPDVQRHNSSEFVHNGIRYRTIPLFTDEKQGADHYESIKVWAQQYAAAFGSGGPQSGPASGGNGGNFPEGEMAPAPEEPEADQEIEVSPVVKSTEIKAEETIE